MDILKNASDDEKDIMLDILQVTGGGIAYFDMHRSDTSSKTFYAKVETDRINELCEVYNQQFKVNLTRPQLAFLRGSQPGDDASKQETLNYAKRMQCLAALDHNKSICDYMNQLNYYIQ